MIIVKCWDIRRVGRRDRPFYVNSIKVADLWKEKHPDDDIFDKEFMIFETVDEIKAFDDAELRKQALAKLTDAEKAVLGVK